MPFLLLSAAAARLPASFFCVGVPVLCLVLPLPCAAPSPGSCSSPYCFSLSCGFSLSLCLLSWFASCGDGLILGFVFMFFVPCGCPSYTVARDSPLCSVAPSGFLVSLSVLLCVSFWSLWGPGSVLSWGFNWGSRTRL